MTMNYKMETLKNELKSELTENILPFWLKMSDPEGGFWGRMDGKGNVHKESCKGAVMTARILWTFSAAYRLIGNEIYLRAATRGKREIIDRFYDREHGGVYWSIDSSGSPLDTKKQIYALGFAIYGLSEYCRATGDKEALDYAVRLYEDIEKHSFDYRKNGYYEAFDREWNIIEDMRLSDKDANESKTMNTHLHIIEPYTNLYRVWKSDELKDRIDNLITLFTDKFTDSDSGHLRLFFDNDWICKSDIISYGHDIEAAWLLYEAGSLIYDKENESDAMTRLVKSTTKTITAASEGFFPNGGMIYEMELSSGKIDADRHWWVQAETITGYVYQALIPGELYLAAGFPDSGKKHIANSLSKAFDCWEFTKKHIIDHRDGEWFWSLKADGTANTDDDKAGFWKCTYHNGRMCIEIIEKLENLR